MRGIVTEIRGDRTVVLSGDGLFRNIKNKSYSRGQRIELKQWGWQSWGMSMNRIRINTAAVFLILLCLSVGGTAFAYYLPTSYVSLDINPSLQLDVNRFGRVIGIHPINNEAEQLVAGQGLKHLEMDKAVNEIVKKAALAGYFKNPATNAILITISDKDPERMALVAQAILKETKQITGSSGTMITVETDKLSPDWLRKAKEYNSTPGKLRLIQKYLGPLSAEEAQRVTMSQWVQKPIKEIMEAIHDQEQRNKLANKERSHANIGHKEEKQNQGLRNQETRSNTNIPGEKVDKERKNSSDENKSGEQAKEMSDTLDSEDPDNWVKINIKNQGTHQNDDQGHSRRSGGKHP